MLLNSKSFEKTEMLALAGEIELLLISKLPNWLQFAKIKCMAKFN